MNIGWLAVQLKNELLTAQIVNEGISLDPTGLRNVAVTVKLFVLLACKSIETEQKWHMLKKFSKVTFGESDVILDSATHNPIHC